MNIETLLQAAEFVELQEVAKEAVTRGYNSPPGLHEYAKSGNSSKAAHRKPNASSSLEKRAYHTSHFARSSNELPYAREEERVDHRRRPGTCSREVHNKLEKNRRAHLKECFEMVKKQLPACSDDKKSSNLSILHNAIKYINALRRKDREHEHEMEKLAREKIALQQKFANLKKELAAQWDHIDFNMLVPDTIISEHEEVVVTSETGETSTLQNSAGCSSTSSLSSATTATASASPQLPPSVPEVKIVPGTSLIKKTPSDRPKVVTFPNRFPPKRPVATKTVKPAATHLQLPMITNTSSGHTFQLLASSNLRMVSTDPGEVAYSLAQGSRNTSGVTLIRRSSEEDPISLVPGNGVRGNGQVLTIPNGSFHKNGVIYNQPRQSQAHLSSGFTHVVGPLAGSRGTIVTPVTVVSQGNQLSHIIASPSGKVVAPLTIKPLMPQYVVKQGSGMMVLSKNSTASQNVSK